ncbi:N-acyl-D-amino-acid deacylase family protein [Sphingopyxis sp.]|jgi:N-acyl-D-aspartate/D-glutamate deacylase|uniref:N-acyl-D-amino-acid deacylase family protein n=1 Tax=Sphingopyxis sp. TaxID=1908224 RepID=UPI002DFD97CE|nr:amidohydrolase family protein [Sphingopyxis sp.]
MTLSSTTFRDRGATMASALGLAAAMVSLAAAQPAQAQAVRNADLVIQGGTIYDGSSQTPIIGDLAISGDKIVYVGAAAKNPYKGAKVIDARGLVVAPGFIDPHTHADTFLTGTEATTRLNLPWMMQGVTTIFTGVDGHGQPGGKVDIAGLFDGIDRNKFGVNVAAYVGFGAVRRAVIGDADRAPTGPELDRMKRVVADGMCQGALGFSTGLFYAPQSFSKTNEVIAIAREAAIRGGIYDSHQRDESSYTIGVVDSTKEGIEIGRAAGMPVHFAHFKALGVDVHGKGPELIATIENARAEGLQVTADQYPWEASGSGLEASLLPRWAVDGGRAPMLKRLDDPAALEMIKAEMRDNLRRRGGANSLLLTAPNQPWTAKRLDEVAREWNFEPIDAALRIIRESERGTSVVSFNMAEKDIKLLMKQAWVMTSSDGSHGHPRMYATFPRKYAKYVLDEKAISIAEFINSSSGQTADTFKLDRRGHLRNGYFADVVVFDPKSYRPKADYVNPEMLTLGVQALLVNGVVAVERGTPTGAAAGRGLKHVPPAGSCS